MKRTTAFFVALAAISFVLLFSGCGQSGPLYVPGDPSRMAVPPADEASTDDDQEEGDPPATEATQE